MSPDYVMDRMEQWEVEPLLMRVEAMQHPGWEQARLIAITSANAMGCNVKYSDFALPWEQQEHDDEDASQSNEMHNKALAKLRELKKNENVQG